jgi:hypothetical protein
MLRATGAQRLSRNEAYHTAGCTTIETEGISVENAHYTHDAEGNLSITDGREFEPDISEFSARE